MSHLELSRVSHHFALIRKKIVKTRSITKKCSRVTELKARGGNLQTVKNPNTKKDRVAIKIEYYDLKNLCRD